MRSLVIVLLCILPVSLAQFCGPDEIPDKIAVNQDGEVALGCRYNECPRDPNNAAIKSAPPKCGNRYYELACPGPLQWVGGIPRGSNINNVVPLQCCSAQSLKDSPQAGQDQKIVERGQVYEGKVYTDKLGNIIGYDIIKNVQKISLGQNSYGLSVNVARLNCEPKRAAQIGLHDAQFNPGQPREVLVSRIDGGGAFQGPLLPPQTGGELLQPGLGDAGLAAAPFADPGIGAVPLGMIHILHAGFAGAPLGAAPAAAAPAFGGFPGLGGFGGGAGAACFTGETMIETTSGSMQMKDLKIGDTVLTVDNNMVGWSKVESFLHRLPEKEAEFHRISGADGSSITMTPQHFIYTTPCDTIAPSMKYAKDVVPGKECLVKADRESVKQAPVAILSNEVSRITGVYNPMTGNGVIVADGYMASCHNVVADSSFMNTFTETVQKLQKMFSWETSEDRIELPWALQLCVDHASKFL